MSERGTMFDPGPAFYMEKIAVGPSAAHCINVTASVEWNLRNIAGGLDKQARPEAEREDASPPARTNRT